MDITIRNIKIENPKENRYLRYHSDGSISVNNKYLFNQKDYAEKINKTVGRVSQMVSRGEVQIIDICNRKFIYDEEV